MTLPNRIFITGTNTDIGKTVVSAVLVAGLRAHYWKPIQSGLIDGTDTNWIQAHTDIPQSHIHKETYSLQQPLSPHAAAVIDNIEISLDAFSLPVLPEEDFLIIEGAGGVLVPINKKYFMLDLIEKLGAPVLIVADSELGTINHSLLTIRHLYDRNIEIAGVVMNGPQNQGNKEAIEFYGNVEVIAEIEPLKELNPETLADCFTRSFQQSQLP
jgi:dethiobiotin synthase